MLWMSNSMSARVVILGSGPAGLTAAIYAARAGLTPIVIQGIQPGGQLTTTTDVENYPGFRDVIQGPWLMEEMQAQAEHVGTQGGVGPHRRGRPVAPPVPADGRQRHDYFADTLVIATGAQAKWLNLPSEEHMKGRGASACATCDGFFYRGKKVAVIGGGNTAVEEALYLTNHSHDVTLIHRRDSLRAEKILQDRLFANPAIKVVWDSEVVEFVGGGEPEALVGLDMREPRSGRDQPRSTSKARSSPSAIRPRPSCSTASSSSTRTATSRSRAARPQTNIPGVFACGDVMDKIYRQAVTAAGTGCMAALDAEKYLAAQEFEAIAAE